jgi:ADP-ribosylglycohydrolase
MTPDGRVFDVGIQTSRALSALAGGASPQEAGPAGERDNGNGALMRVLPVVWMARSLDEAIDLAMRQGLVTHGHIRSQLCCALYAIVGLRMLEGMNAHDSLEFAQNALRERFAKSAHAREAQRVLDGRLEAPRGSGYVVDSLWSALDCVLETSDYETCVRRAVMLGNDTDTTACIAGGLAGLL